MVSGRNSFACNLPARSKARKIAAWSTISSANLGVRPKAYKAGRYGIRRDDRADAGLDAIVSER